MNFDEIFGVDSEGSTPDQRAATSSRTFVRSQVQLALDSDAAKGRRLTATEALATFGLPFLETVVTEGGAGFLQSGSEPASTISGRRRYLRLSKRALAQAAGVTIEEVTASETPGNISPIRTLEKIAQALALDERALGVKAEAKGDTALGARLRELRQSEGRDDAFVATLADAAWIIGRQRELSRLLTADKNNIEKFTARSSDYSWPAYERGYALAERTREILGISDESPILSTYSLAQDMLGVPVIDTDLGEGIAGATLINGGSRGIVLSTEGPNRSALVRRMTLAHELGHLLWDPDGQLEHVRIDASGNRVNRDPVEIRANAFAVAFLAPRKSVASIVKERGNSAATVSIIVEKFGISPNAAANHIANVCKLSSGDVSYNKANIASLKKWSENERQADLVKGHAPPSRSGRFAQLAIQAQRKGLITTDTLVSWLRVDHRTLRGFF